MNWKDSVIEPEKLELEWINSVDFISFPIKVDSVLLIKTTTKTTGSSYKDMIYPGNFKAFVLTKILLQKRKQFSRIVLKKSWMKLNQRLTSVWVDVRYLRQKWLKNKYVINKNICQKFCGFLKSFLILIKRYLLTLLTKQFVIFKWLWI